MPRVYHANLSFCCKPESSYRAESSAVGMRGDLAITGAGGGKASRLVEITAALASPHSSSHMRKWDSILAKESEKKREQLRGCSLCGWRGLRLDCDSIGGRWGRVAFITAPYAAANASTLEHLPARPTADAVKKITPVECRLPLAV